MKHETNGGNKMETIVREPIRFTEAWLCQKVRNKLGQLKPSEQFEFVAKIAEVCNNTWPEGRDESTGLPDWALVDIMGS
jgi:hypothetical protein